MNLSDFLKHIRMRHNLTQAQLGEICLRSKDWTYLCEQGKLEPSNEDLILISTKLQEPLLLLIAYGKTVSSLIELKKQT